MNRDRILTTHAGSLPRPDELIGANSKREGGDTGNEGEFQQILAAGVKDVVRRQSGCGVDIVGDGEFGKSMGHRVNYRAWWSYIFNRLNGLELGGASGTKMPIKPPLPGELIPYQTKRRRDRVLFAAAYSDPESGVYVGPGVFVPPVCVGPISYKGHDAIKADIANFKAALSAAGASQGFMTSVAPGSACRFPNAFYGSTDEFLFASADAMREEYKAILESGLILQLDDPSIAESWDAIEPEPSLESYRKFAMRRVEALNYAIRGLPADRIRFHLCWGSWHGPHITDLPMRDIIDLMLAVKCGAYSFEAGNVRHEHEWSVWKDTKLPDDKVVLPGVVSHATNVVEHPDLIAERILRFTGLLGRERVIASTDCGLGGRVHYQIAWAKLDALAEGARRASKVLWQH